MAALRAVARRLAGAESQIGDWGLGIGDWGDGGTTQHSALSTQHSALSTDHLFPEPDKL